MADVERHLLAKAIHTGQVEQLMAAGVEATHFADPECGQIWEWCVEHARQYRSSPSLRAAKQEFANHNFEIISDPLEYVVDQFKADVARRKAIDSLRTLADVVSDPKRVGQITDFFLEEARRLANVVPSVKASRYSEMELRIEAWKSLKATGTLPGIPTGLPTLDKHTYGIQPSEMLSIVGWQGLGKSTLTQVLVFNSYIKGKTPLIISLEMGNLELQRKWDVMATHLSQQRMKGLELTQEEVETWEREAERAKNASNDIIVIDDIGYCTVDRVYAEAVKYKPDLVAVDYVSLLDTQRSITDIWQKMTHITRQLKQNARGLNIPHIAVAQTNIDSADEGALLSNIAYSRSIGQDSDIVLGLAQSDQQYENKQMTIRLLKNRDGVKTSFNMFWDPDIGEFHEWDPGDMFRERA